MNSSGSQRKMFRALSLALIFLSGAATARADIRLPTVLSSNMVLQQQSAVKFWGWADPDEKVLVTASWNGRTDSTKANGNAKWAINVQTPAAGGPYTITIKGRNTITLQNVLIGEVWVCSGQSNMEMSYSWGLPQMNRDLPAAANTNIRFFRIPHRTAETPQESGEGTWELCDSNTVKSFSAVGYYYGKKLNADLHVPVGLIQAAWGGTPAEVWAPADVVNGDPVLQEAAGKINPSNWWPVTPGYTYNGMIAPIVNFPIAGAIWYQGESNTGTAATYQSLFTAMIDSWRRKWNKEFPFYFVQLAPYRYGNANIAALLREAQTQSLTLPKTGMVVTTDLADDTMDIHPRMKKEVGTRLAGLALLQTYGQAVEGVVGPVFRDMKINKNKMIVSFDHADQGLLVKGKAPEGFQIAGQDKVFYPAQGKVAGKTIILWSKAVKEPVAVRYAFSNTAIGNIFSKEGLPLSPFRTDHWEVDTTAVK